LKPRIKGLTGLAGFDSEDRRLWYFHQQLLPRLPGLDSPEMILSGLNDFGSLLRQEKGWG
jgi:hypothetical protein